MTAVVSLSAGQQSGDIPAIRFEAVYGGQASSAIPYPVARLDDGEQGADLDRARAGSLAIAQPLPIRDVLLLMFRGTGFSVVFDPAVTGSFIGELSDLSLRQALEAVLVPARLDYRREGRVIQVFPPHTETRLFEVGHLDIRRTWKRRATGGEGADGGVAADLTATVESDFFGELSDGVRALLSAGRTGPRRSERRHRPGHRLRRSPAAGRDLHRDGAAARHASGANRLARARGDAHRAAGHRLDRRGESRRYHPGIRRRDRRHRFRPTARCDWRFWLGASARRAANPGDQQRAGGDAHRLRWGGGERRA